MAINLHVGFEWSLLNLTCSSESQKSCLPWCMCWGSHVQNAGAFLFLQHVECNFVLTAYRNPAPLGVCSIVTVDIGFSSLHVDTPCNILYVPTRALWKDVPSVCPWQPFPRPRMETSTSWRHSPVHLSLNFVPLTLPFLTTVNKSQDEMLLSALLLA